MSLSIYLSLYMYIYIYIYTHIHLGLGGVVALLRLERGLQGRLLGPLRRHELLVGLLRVRLLGVVLLDVHGEGVVHALQDALDLRRLGRVVAERVVAHLGGIIIIIAIPYYYHDYYDYYYYCVGKEKGGYPAKG